MLDAQGTKSRWLAEKVGISESHLSRIITGERRISKRLAERICDFARVDFHLAFELTDDRIIVPIREREEAVA